MLLSNLLSILSYLSSFAAFLETDNHPDQTRKERQNTSSEMPISEVKNAHENEKYPANKVKNHHGRTGFGRLKHNANKILPPSFASGLP